MTRIKTHDDFVVTVEEDSEGVLLGIFHGIGGTNVVLRPTQAERLAVELLAYANGDHKLPPGAVRPRRIVEGSEMPHTSVCNGEPRCWCGEAHDDAYQEMRYRTDPPPFGMGLPE